MAAEVGGGGATWTVYTGPQWPPLLGLVRIRIQSKAEPRVSSMSEKLD